MEKTKLIPAIDFCTVHCVELTLIETVSACGLIDIVMQDEAIFIQEHEVKKLEQILVFHNDLDLNFEAIDTIFSLLNRIETMQDRIYYLENKLQRFNS